MTVAEFHIHRMTRHECTRSMIVAHGTSATMRERQTVHDEIRTVQLGDWCVIRAIISIVVILEIASIGSSERGMAFIRWRSTR